jgi:hypothetical protein
LNDALADLQKVIVKVPLALPPGAVDGLLVLLDGWRHADAAAGADWVDVVDNAHLAGGLAVQLVGRRFTIGVDLDAPPSWVHLHKRGLAGAPEERVAGVVRATLAEVARLAADPARPDGVRVLLDRLWIGVNDRVTAPNRDDTDAALAPALSAVGDRLYGAAAWAHERDADPRARFGWWLRPVAPPVSLDALIARL